MKHFLLKCLPYKLFSDFHIFGPPCILYTLFWIIFALIFINKMIYWIHIHTWKPDFILATEHLDPQDSHCKKNNLVSFWRMVSGDRQVWHVTYSLIYLQEKKIWTIKLWFNVFFYGVFNLQHREKNRLVH